MLSATSLLELFFKLFRCPDKSLRQMLYAHIVADVRHLNAGHKNAAVNKTLQNFMYGMLTDDNAIAAKMSLDVMVELHHRRVWDDAKTVNVIATACFSPVTKIMVAALKFFLDSDVVTEDDNATAGEGAQDEYQRALKAAGVRKPTKKQQSALQRAQHALKRKTQRMNKTDVFRYSAIHLLNDPQSMAERLFAQLKQCNEAFEVKLMMMNLISRMIGVHKVSVCACRVRALSCMHCSSSC